MLPKTRPDISRKLAGSLASDRLDLVRGVAALVVLWGHVRAIMFVNGHEIAHPSHAIWALYFATSLGHEAVMIFFVLSGFLISGSAIKAYQEGRWSWRWYLTNRFTRLYVVLLPALLLGAFWDRAGVSIFGTGGIYGGHQNFVVQVPVASCLTIKTFFGNALFLQTIVVPTLGSNGALWSLTNEFWYYIAFALLLTAVLDSRPALRITCLAGAVAVGLGVGAQISLYFLIWSMGVALNFLPQLERRSGLLLTACVATFFLALLTIYSLHGMVSDFIIGLATTFLIYAMLQNRARSGDGMFAALSHRLANMSYTLYLVHLPLVVFISALVVRNGRWQPDSFHLLLGLLVIVIGVIYASVVAKWTEANTGAIRQRVSEYLDRLLPASHAAKSKIRPAGIVDSGGN